MKKCWMCKQIVESSKFCEVCGTKLKEDELEIDESLASRLSKKVEEYETFFGESASKAAADLLFPPDDSFKDSNLKKSKSKIIETT